EYLRDPSLRRSPRRRGLFRVPRLAQPCRDEPDGARRVSLRESPGYPPGAMTARRNVMLTRREKAPMAARDPFALLKRMTSEFDRLFDEPMFAGFRLPAMAEFAEQIEWTPRIEVFEKDNRL